MADTIDPKDVLSAFCEKPSTCSVRVLGQGRINDTFLVESVVSPFVLQRISSSVFPEPIRVIQNFQKVSNHLAAKSGQINDRFMFAAPVYTRQGEISVEDSNGDLWRAQTFIPHTNIEAIGGYSHAHQVGLALAAFHYFIADLDILDLQDPLPDFHYLPHYLEEFDQESNLLPSASKGDMGYCLERTERFRSRSSVIEEAKNNGVITAQPIHGDPKIDNFLFDDQGEAFGLLDLDTVGAGLVHHDLGDCLRSCCNRAGEVGTEPVTFDIKLCRALLEGYFSWPHTRFSAEQCDLIYDGVFLISFELGLRFLTDHLRGNVYFKVGQDGDNLLRAVRQFWLTDDIRRQEQDIRSMAISMLKH